jgi:hypothetical protein
VQPKREEKAAICFKKVKNIASENHSFEGEILK